MIKWVNTVELCDIDQWLALLFRRCILHFAVHFHIENSLKKSFFFVYNSCKKKKTWIDTGELPK